MKPLNPGESRQVGRYRLVALLGEGGMGRVLLGVSPDGRLVALKQVHPGFAHDEGFRSRFHREVQTSRMVSGAYTAAVMDADPEAATPWLASVFVAGPSLKEAIDAAGPLPVESVRFLAVGLASALGEIHRVGLIHRDLKPSNVLLTDDGPRVIDFGIARAAEGDTELTHTGSIIGSPGFMSPEQADGRPVTPASDIFSLGALLVMAATGQGPFTGTSTPQTLYNVVHTQPDLRMLHPDVRRLAEPCLAKDPAQRPTPAQILDFLGSVTPSATPWPPTVHTMIARQKAEVNTALSLPAPAPEPVTARPGKRRGRLIAAIAAASVVVLGAAATTVVLLNRDSSPPAAAPAGSTPGPPPVDPLSFEVLRTVDPCKLLDRDSTPQSGPITGAEDQTEFTKCKYGLQNSALGKNTPVTISLAEPMTRVSGGEPVTIESLEAVQKKSSSSGCVVMVTIPTQTGFGLQADSSDAGANDCAVATEFAQSMVKRLRAGNPPTVPTNTGTALTVDMCTTVPKKELEKVVGQTVRVEVKGLFECSWTAGGIYSIRPLRASDPAGKLTGPNVSEIAGVPVLDERDTSSCSISWLQRKITHEIAEKTTLSHTLSDSEQKDPGRACAQTREFAKVVISALPKA
ncbi:serine/threonine-protein kinase [Amycolatopsis samaneae]